MANDVTRYNDRNTRRDISLQGETFHYSMISSIQCLAHGAVIPQGCLQLT